MDYHKFFQIAFEVGFRPVEGRHIIYFWKNGR
jgi:hypothetical protein|uniref:Uncharacterized protein n=1 Tax=viral metagenome TaxID=1070528 RepID=A0A6C0JLC5_9ZZZZ